MSLALASQVPSLTRAADLSLLPSPNNSGVQIAQIFSSSVLPASLMDGKRSFVWSALTPGHGGFTSYYVPGFRDGNPAHTITWYQANHPDWIVYKNDRTTWVDDFSDVYVAVDFTNPAVRDYLLTWAKAGVAAGFSAVAMDNVSIDNVIRRAGHFDSNNVWHQDFTDAAYDAPFPAAIKDYINWFHQNLNAARIPLIVNVELTWSGHNLGDVATIARCADGMLHEGAFFDGGVIKWRDAAWLDHFNFHFPYTNSYLFCALASISTTLANISNSDAAWVVANFLLVKGPYSFLWCGSGAEYGAWQGDYPASFAPNVGTPTSDPVKVGGVYQRNFSNGFVAVNPSSLVSAAYTVPAGTWLDNFGNSVSAGANTLAAETAITLIKQ